MHDSIIGDRLGIPSAGIMTEKFTSAADLMARVLGADGYTYAVIDHPISSAGLEALKARAATAAEVTVGILTG